MATRISLLKQALGLYDPGFCFVFASEARDRPGQATCRRHLDIEGTIALRRYLECHDCHTRQYAATISQHNLYIPTSPQVRMEYVSGWLRLLMQRRSWHWPIGAVLKVRGRPRRSQQTILFSRCWGRDANPSGHGVIKTPPIPPSAYRACPSCRHADERLPSCPAPSVAIWGR